MQNKREPKRNWNVILHSSAARWVVCALICVCACVWPVRTDECWHKPPYEFHGFSCFFYFIFFCHQRFAYCSGRFREWGAVGRWGGGNPLADDGREGKKNMPTYVSTKLNYGIWRKAFLSFFLSCWLHRPQWKGRQKAEYCGLNHLYVQKIEDLGHKLNIPPLLCD